MFSKIYRHRVEGTLIAAEIDPQGCVEYIGISPEGDIDEAVDDLAILPGLEYQPLTEKPEETVARCLAYSPGDLEVVGANEIAWEWVDTQTLQWVARHKIINLEINSDEEFIVQESPLIMQRLLREGHAEVY